MGGWREVGRRRNRNGQNVTERKLRECEVFVRVTGNVTEVTEVLGCVSYRGK